MNSTTQHINSNLILEMPDGLALGFNPSLDNFDWSDVLPSNYWSLEALQEKFEDTGTYPVITPDYVKIQVITDPEKADDQQDLSPKLVLYFKEATPALVLNKSRCQLISKMTGTRNPAKWLSILKDPIQLEAGILNGKAQITFKVAEVKPVPDQAGLIPQMEERPVESGAYVDDGIPF